MAIVKMQEAGLTPSGLTTAQGSASARKADTELTLPDGTKVAGNALDPQMLAARKTFEKEALLQNKASGAMDGPIRNRGEQEWDTFLVSFSREEMSRMSPEQMQEYADTVIETMASGASNNRAGQKMYFKQEMHMDTNNAHVYFGIHRHAIDTEMAKPTISPTIDLKDKSEAAAAAEAVNQALADKGFAKLDNWINWNGVSLYGDLRTPDSAKEAAASQLEKLGVEELPPSLKTGTPDHQRASAEQVLERIRARDPDMVALEQAEKIKAKELADLNAAAEKVAAEVAAINAAKLAVQDKLDALALRDAATAERDAAVQARDEALTVRDSAVAERDSAVQAKGEAEALRDAAVAESEAKGNEIVRLAEELREKGLLIEGMTNDHAAEVEELQGQVAQRDAELTSTREALASETARAEGLSTELNGTKDELTKAVQAKADAEAETRRIVAEMTAEREQFKKILEQQGALMARSEAQLKGADEQMRALRDELRTQREEQSRALVEARRDANEQAREIQRLREELGEVKAAKPEQAAPSADEPAPPAGSTAGGRALKGDIEKLEQQRKELRDLGRKAGESGPKKDDDLDNK